MVVLRKTKKVSHTKTIILGTLAVLILLGAATIAFRQFTKNNQPSASTTRTATSDGINFDPPTQEEQEAGDKKKEEISKGTDQPSPPPSANGADVLITYGDVYAGNVEVGAYIANIFEDGGTCKLSLKKGTVEHTATSQGVKNVSTTNCPALSIVTNKLSPGVWAATVTYTSPTISGTSKAKDITVQ